ncbi:MAG: hypothetical protein GX988_04355 [Clostridiales bacterium]|nr:hypothetical protein [Clostridiales bacterium]
MSLSSKEKIMVVMLVLIATWALGIMFILKPSYVAMNEKQETLSAKISEKQDIETKIKDGSAMKTRIRKAKRESKESASKFFPHTKDFEADKYVYKILNDKKIDISSLDISILDIYELEIYEYQPNELAYAIKDYINPVAAPSEENESGDADQDNANNDNSDNNADSNNPQNDENSGGEPKDDPETNSETVAKISVEATIEGKYKDVKDILDTIANDEKTIYTQKYTIVEKGKDKFAGSIVVDFYCIEQVEEDE